MLKKLLASEEGKSLEFKQNSTSLQKIIQTIVAFANTAGGVLVIGVQDKTKEVLGLRDILQEEERLASAIADSISPMIFPLFQVQTWHGRDLLIISVQHSFGPYFVKSKGLDGGTYVRLGSTNRLADQQTISQIQQLKEHKNFDEQPNVACPLSAINFALAKQLFAEVSKKFTDKSALSLALIVDCYAKKMPSNGAVLLFASEHKNYFPDAFIRLGRFLGTDKAEILDYSDLEVPLVQALDQIIAFIRRHTSMAAKVGATRRVDTPQYPPVAVREAVINALVHADYAIKGASMQVAIFDDRIEISNPGCLPFGLSMEIALSGGSLLRNRVIGRVFRELHLIEQWGSGFERMRAACLQHGTPPPKFEEFGNFFKVTLYHSTRKPTSNVVWHKPIIEYLGKYGEISPRKAQTLWKVTSRTTSSRLKKMCELGILVVCATGPFDPKKHLACAMHSDSNEYEPMKVSVW